MTALDVSGVVCCARAGTTNRMLTRQTKEKTACGKRTRTTGIKGMNLILRESEPAFAGGVDKPGVPSSRKRADAASLSQRHQPRSKIVLAFGKCVAINSRSIRC